MRHQALAEIVASIMERAMDTDTQALLALLGDDSRALLLDVARALTRIESRLANDVPPADVRAGMDEATEHISDESAHIAATEAQSDDQQFVTKQLISIMQGTRTDLVEMRVTLRHLSALLEQTLQARALDDEAWTGSERRSIVDRRKAS